MEQSDEPGSIRSGVKRVVPGKGDDVSCFQGLLKRRADRLNFCEQETGACVRLSPSHVRPPGRRQEAVAYKRRGPTLFEVLNKRNVGGSRSPAVPVRGAGHHNDAAGFRKPASVGPLGELKTPVAGVAQSISEEEAAAELAAVRKAAEQARQEAEAAELARKARLEARRAEKEELRRARQAAKIARLEAKRIEAERRAANPAAYPSRRIPLTAATVMLFSGAAVAVGIVGYSLGRGRTKDKPDLATVAAVTEAAPSASHRSPLGKSKVATPEVKTAVAREIAGGQNPDLEHMLQSAQPKGEAPQVAMNKPAGVGPAGGAAQAAAALPENLNYLQIESFRVTRERDSEQLARDVADAREYLLQRGIRTFARRKSNGFVLFAERGYPPSKEHAASREAFRREIESLGAEYRKQGGQYQFKGCLFVSFGVTQSGEPM